VDSGCHDAAIVSADFTDAGHAVAVILGMVPRVSRPCAGRRAPFMLVNSTGFGFLIWLITVGMAATLALVCGRGCGLPIAQFSSVRLSAWLRRWTRRHLTDRQPVATG